MAVQVNIPVSVVQTPGSGPNFDRNGLNADGTLRIDYFTKSLARSDESWSERMMQVWKNLKRELFVSPASLAFVVFMIMFVPKRLFQFRSYLSGLVKVYSKRSLDVLGSGFGLLASVGLFFYLPLLIRIDSKGKIVYKQKRIGRDRRSSREDRRKISLVVSNEKRQGNRRDKDLMGQPFNVYKLRSMQENAEKKTGPTWAKKNDPRITRLGRILRPTHLDEIPQFYNVLKGDMSLVGPRPERPELIPELNKKIPNYTKRLKQKPGITGLAQVLNGYDATMNDVVKKVKYDLFYIEKENVFFDIQILLSTFKMIILPKKHKNGQLSKVSKDTALSMKVTGRLTATDS